MSAESKIDATLTSPLRGEVGAQRRVRGVKVSARSIDRARTLRRNQTDAERAFWNPIRNRQLGGFKFVRQFPVGSYVADFVCRAEMLIVELDGGQHAVARTDEERTTFLNEHGYAVLRFWNNEILENKEGCCLALLSVLEGTPSPDLRFAPATLSPEGAGGRGATLKLTGEKK